MKLKELETRAKAGDLQAQFSLGYAYLKGKDDKNMRNVSYHGSMNIPWKNKYSKHTQRMLESYASVKEDNIKIDLEKPVKRNPNEALHWIKLSAEGGEKTACKVLGKFYQFGFLVGQNYQEAIRWFRLAGASGHASLAEVYTEIFFKNGDLDDYLNLIAEEDDEVLLEMAINLELGDNEVEYMDYYYERDNVEDYSFGPREDYEYTVKILRIPAERGNLEAIYELGLCYYHDHGFHDEDEAFAWFSKGSALGDDKCRMYLGKCYEKGIGTEQNRAKAEEIYAEMKEKGYEFRDE